MVSVQVLCEGYTRSIPIFTFQNGALIVVLATTQIHTVELKQNPKETIFDV